MIVGHDIAYLSLLGNDHAAARAGGNILREHGSADHIVGSDLYHRVIYQCHHIGIGKILVSDAAGGRDHTGAGILLNGDLRRQLDATLGRLLLPGKRVLLTHIQIALRHIFADRLIPAADHIII